jgi:hypothetical protein
LEFYNIIRNIFNEKSIYKGCQVEADYTFYLTEAYAAFPALLAASIIFVSMLNVAVTAP